MFWQGMLQYSRNNKIYQPSLETFLSSMKVAEPEYRQYNIFLHVDSAILSGLD